jgi:hypothetical protein
MMRKIQSWKGQGGEGIAHLWWRPWALHNYSPKAWPLWLLEEFFNAWLLGTTSIHLSSIHCKKISPFGTLRISWKISKDLPIEFPTICSHTFNCVLAGSRTEAGCALISQIKPQSNLNRGCEIEGHFPEPPKYGWPCETLNRFEFGIDWIDATNVKSYYATSIVIPNLVRYALLFETISSLHSCFGRAIAASVFTAVMNYEWCIPMPRNLYLAYMRSGLLERQR